MLKRLLLTLAAVALMAHYPNEAHAWPVRFGIGLNFGIPVGPVYSPYPYAYPYSAYPYSYYPAYPPVVVQQPPVAVGTAPTTTQPIVAGSAPVMSPAEPISPPPVANAPTFTGVQPAVYDRSAVDGQLSHLGEKDENVRKDAAISLGRMRADRAIDPLSSMLSGDSSPAVRDAAARALGLIGSSRCLSPLIRAAQADDDREVRHSAQFAVEVIRSQMPR